MIVGDDEALGRLLEGYGIEDRSMYVGGAEEVEVSSTIRSVEEILAAADKIDVPAELQRLFDREYGEDPFEPDPGEWPEPGSQAGLGLTVHADILTGKPFARVHIVILPTSQSTEAAAYLGWGGWNACPMPEVHVAVQRKWSAEYGAQVVGISHDVVNLRVTRRPATPEEAMELAREQYLYCSDLVLQGTETLEVLAGSLLDSDWWYFWWD